MNDPQVLPGIGHFESCFFKSRRTKRRRKKKKNIPSETAVIEFGRHLKQFFLERGVAVIAFQSKIYESDITQEICVEAVVNEHRGAPDQGHTLQAKRDDNQWFRSPACPVFASGQFSDIGKAILERKWVLKRRKMR
jgi:hypothetical protein